MDSNEVDIKPVIQTDDTPDKSWCTAPNPNVSKLKLSRYEDVWPEDVHAAFMEAITLYPPMGKRRLKYYRVPTPHESEHFSGTNRAKSFGRCQLIQSYIFEKTGKNRSRKQVSSHLQRLKKIHKDNPAMHRLFSECSQLSFGHCSTSQAVAITSQGQDTPLSISSSMRHPKDNFDLTVPVDLQDTETHAGDSPISPCSPEASPFNSNLGNALDLANFHNQPILFAQELHSPQQCPAGTLRSTDIDYLPELQDTLLLKDSMNGGFRSGSAFSTSAFSISMCRFASRRSIQGRVDPVIQPSRAVHGVFQPTHQWISHDGLVNGFSCNSPLISAQQLLHTPLRSLHFLPAEKQWFDPSMASDWTWPQNSDVGLGSRESTFGEVYSRYSPATLCYPNPAAYLDVRANSPGFHSPLSEIEVSRLPRGIPYPYSTTSPLAVSESISANSVTGQAVQPPSENPLPSPSVIMPIPQYPVSYIHSGDAHTPSPTLLP